jgi:hypothetical protein
MLRNLVVTSSLLLVAFLTTSCNRQRESAESRSAQMPGTWELQMGDGCADYPIRSDTLVLRPDGTFDEHTVAKDGRALDSVGQNWEYLEENSISLDKLRNWDFQTDPSHPSSRGNGISSDGPEGIIELQVLIVQFGNPPVILINPHSDCVYVKTK